jgi:ATP-dependent Clp protease adaptor protein ClpS
MPAYLTQHSNPQLQPSQFTETAVEAPWTLTLFDDDIHTFDEVIHQLIKALGCDQPTAEEITITVHNTGSAVVYEGPFEECFRINAVLVEIQLVTEIRG